MDIVTGFIAFIMIWWTVLQGVLPMGVEMPDNHEIGHATSAPKDAKILKKMLLTTAISVAVWLAFFLFIHYSSFSFNDLIKDE